MSEGTIVRVVGPVVDVDFSEAKKVPKIYDALEVTFNVGNENHRLVLEVQQDLAADGYYASPIDGRMGPQTRGALAAFQADNGLAVTSAIDEPTLQTLGLA